MNDVDTVVIEEVLTRMFIVQAIVIAGKPPRDGRDLQ
jgi:hypothetical protein